MTGYTVSYLKSQNTGANLYGFYIDNNLLKGRAILTVKTKYTSSSDSITYTSKASNASSGFIFTY